MSDVFISYSRKDIAFARLLQESLQQSQLDIWIDWDRIPVGERWWEEICQAIENANVFMFIISKASIGSSVCKDEIYHALKNNKRIIPVIVDKLQPEAIQEFAPELPQFNWIIFEKDKIFLIEENLEITSEKPEDSQVALPKIPQFEEALGKLSKTIHTDWKWVKYHTRLQVNALLWENNQREAGYELRGAALEEAEGQLLRASGKEPQPTSLQIEFVTLSRAGETLRQEEQLRLEKKARKRQKMVIWAVGIGLVAASILGVVAWIQRNKYQEQRNIAVSRQLSTQALAEADTQYDLAILLSMEANRFLGDPPAYNSNLFEILQSSSRVITFLRGHTNDVTSVAISRDNQTLAIGSGDSTIRLWNISNPDQPLPIGEPLTGHTSGVLTVAFSPDKQLLASGGGDDRIVLWNLENLEKPLAIGSPLAKHTSTIRCLAFSPDGKTLASGSYDATILLWDVSDPAQPKLMGEPLDSHDDTVSSLAFSPDGDLLASTSFDASLILWNVKDPQNAGMAWSSNNFTFAKKMHGQIFGNTIYGLWSVAFSPDGKMLATSDDNNAIQLWKVDELSVKNSVPLIDFPTDHIATINSVVFSPDGNTLATGSVDRSIRLWDISKPDAPTRIGQPLIGHASDISSLAFSPDGKTLVSGSWDNTAILWDVSNLVLPRFLGEQLKDYPSEVIQVAFRPDGQLFASANADKTFSLWDLNSQGQPLRVARPKARHSAGVNSVAFSPDGRILATGSDDASIILWDVSMPDQPAAIGQPLSSHSTQVWRVAFSPDGRLLASSAIGEEIILWDLSDLASPRPIVQPLEGISFAFSPDGNKLATGGYDSPVYISIWDIRDPQAPQLLVKQHMEARMPVLSLAYRADGQLLVSGQYDGKIIFWDVSNERELTQIGQPVSAQKNIVNSVAFSPDSKTMASGSEDRTVALWDIANPQSPVLIGQPFSNHSGAVTSVAFSPDGTELLSSSKDTTIIRWNINFTDLNAVACRQVSRNLTQIEWNQYLPEGDAFRKTCTDLP